MQLYLDKLLEFFFADAADVRGVREAEIQNVIAIYIQIRHLYDTYN